MSNYCKNCYELTEKLEAKEQECDRWKKANDEKNELLAKLGCPTVATARRLAFTLQQRLEQLEAEIEKLKHDHGYEVGALEKTIDNLVVENSRLKWYLNEIRYQELSNLDIDYDEYETNCIDTEYTNIINLVEEALREVSPEE